MLTVGLEQVLKLFYHRTRPCFEFPNTVGGGCACSFGSPSGHTMFATVFFLFLALDILGTRQRPIWKYTSWALCFGAIFAVAFSRVHFGVVSWNEAVLGFLWGLFVYSVSWALEDEIRLGNEAMLIMLDATSDIRIRTAAAYIGVFALLNGLVIFRWFRNKKKFESQVPHPFSKTFCGQTCLAFQPLFSDYHLIGMAIANAGLFLNLIWLALGPPPTPFSTTFCRNQWMNGTITAKRMAVWGVMLAPLFIVFFISLKLDGWKAYWIINSIWIVWIIMFRFVMLKLMIALDCNVVGDYFCNQHGPDTMVYEEITEIQVSTFRK